MRNSIVSNPIWEDEFRLIDSDRHLSVFTCLEWNNLSTYSLEVPFAGELF